MAKIADKYFVTDPFKIIEEDFDPKYSQVAESIFSLGNEYMGVRGNFEEGYTGESLVGNYFNGIYERQKITGSAYKGIINYTEFMVNSVNWLYVRITLDDEQLDLNTSSFKDFKRVLDMETGCLTRSFTWITKNGKELYLEFQRFLSMKNASAAGQKIIMKPLNFSGEVKLTAGLDLTQEHKMAGENLWDLKAKDIREGYLSVLGTTKNTRQSVFSCCHFFVNAQDETDRTGMKKMICKEYTVPVKEQESTSFVRMSLNIVDTGGRDGSRNEFNVKCKNAAINVTELDYERLKEENTEWWKQTWNNSDIVIEGDELNQQGIRYCIFQMHQTYHGARKGTNIGAKGLTGEAYSGNAFWDTETYCLPFYIFNNIEAARNLLEFRYMTLEEAKKRARALDCEGAFYPIATISGKECCSLWQHASLQLQASTAVAYGIWLYDKIVGDDSFLYGKGLPMLVEICRMLVTRGDWNADRTEYGYYGVMGPDEFQMMVHNNCYTNYMGKVTLQYTLKVLESLKSKDNMKYDRFLEKAGLSRGECNTWSIIAEHMHIPYDERTKLYEQHEGFFKLPHIDIDKIPVEEFPLYHHWTYDRIYRNDMIKQPDVLMLMLLYNSSFTGEQLESNYNYYEPRCIHESSLSPSVHSILASQLKKHKKAYEYFGFATRMDLDNYNRNTSEGLHTTSIAAAWMNIVYGFGGLRSDGDGLVLNPSIPAQWTGYTFRICYQGDVIVVQVDKENVFLYTMNGRKINVRVYDNPVTVSGSTTELVIPMEWRG